MPWLQVTRWPKGSRGKCSPWERGGKLKQAGMKLEQRNRGYFKGKNIGAVSSAGKTYQERLSPPSRGSAWKPPGASAGWDPAHFSLPGGLVPGDVSQSAPSPQDGGPLPLLFLLLSHPPTHSGPCSPSETGSSPIMKIAINVLLSPKQTHNPSSPAANL